MPKHWKTISTETIHQNKYFVCKCDQYTAANGESGSYYYGEKYGCALVVPVLDDGRLILVRQFRYLKDQFSVEFPRGAMSEKESPLETAKRGLREETGYEAAEMINLSSFEPSNGSFRDQFNIFLALGLNEQPKQRLDPQEQIEILYRRVDEFEDMIRHGQIWDGPTLATWALAREQVLKIRS